MVRSYIKLSSKVCGSASLSIVDQRDSVYIDKLYTTFEEENLLQTIKVEEDEGFKIISEDEDCQV